MQKLVKSVKILHSCHERFMEQNADNKTALCCILSHRLKSSNYGIRKCAVQYTLQINARDKMEQSLANAKDMLW